MKNYLLSIFFSLIFFPFTNVFGHNITVDGSIADWTGMELPTPVNLGHIARNSSNEGQYIWRDNNGDQRNDFTNPDENVDITEFRTTADMTNLYFMLTFTNLTIDIGNNGVVQVQVAIDRDRDETGEAAFAGFSDTSTSPDAEWEYLIQTRYRTNETPLIYQNGFSTTTNNSTASSIHLTDNFVEFSVPWAEIGGQPNSDTPLRFTVIVVRSSGSNDAEGTPAGNDQTTSSDALDVITNYDNPGATNNTFDEVSDQIVDYYFDVYFEADGDVKSPMLISEFLFNPSGTGADPDAEFVEIFNNTGVNLDLSSYKVGDEETLDGGEGMKQFPKGTILTGAKIVIANDATQFNTTQGYYPDFEFTNHEDFIPDMNNYSTWGTGSVSLTNSGDEILLVDAYDTVVDAVTWGNGTWPNVTDGSAGDGESLERTVATTDTDDVSTDFSTVGSDGSPINNTPSISVAIVSAMTATDEDNNTAYTFRFTRTDRLFTDLEINFSITGSAAAADFMVTSGATFSYSAGSGMITIPCDSASAEITVTPNTDSLVEDTEEFVVTVQAP